jgi:hypothetical protein
MEADIIHNREQNGIEVKFYLGKPSDSTKRILKNFGFKYSSRLGFYYATYSNILWNSVHKELNEFLPKEKKQEKKEISIPEIDTDIFNKSNIKNRIENGQYSYISIYLPTKGGHANMVALTPVTHIARQLVLLFMQLKFGEDWQDTLTKNKTIRPEIYIHQSRCLRKVRELLTANMDSLVEYQIYLLKKGENPPIIIKEGEVDLNTDVSKVETTDGMVVKGHIAEKPETIDEFLASYTKESGYDNTGSLYFQINNQDFEKIGNWIVRGSFTLDQYVNLSSALVDKGFLDEETSERLSKNVKRIIGNLEKPVKQAETVIETEVYYGNSLNIKDYPGPVERNKGIEKLLDRYPDKGGPDEWTSKQVEFMRHYSGSGGKEKAGGEGKGLLWEYYTRDEIVYKMWGLAHKHGFTGGSILEPSCGIGAFFKYAPDDSEIFGYEMMPYSSRIVKILYPRLHLNIVDSVEQKVAYFEQVFIKNNYTIKGKVDHLVKHDLVITNPPYGNMGGKYAGMGEQKYTGAKNYVEYFILRGLDLLNPGGLLIYIIGVEVSVGGVPFLQQGMTRTKEMISERADLIDAYRLYNGVFESTDVLPDIVVLKRK